MANSLRKCVDIAQEKGASSWFSALPVQKHGYALHKWAFIDAVCLHYGWRPGNLPANCVCGKPFTIEHSLSCSFGGFPTIRHNELCDVTANLLSQVCSNVQVDPQLQPMSGETLFHRTSNTDEHARLDISAKGFWNSSHEQAFFDVRVFNPLAKSHLYLAATARMKMRRREHMRNASKMSNMAHSHHSFFSVAGGMGQIASTFYKRLASMLSAKTQQS